MRIPYGWPRYQLCTDEDGGVLLGGCLVKGFLRPAVAKKPRTQKEAVRESGKTHGFIAAVINAP